MLPGVAMDSRLGTGGEGEGWGLEGKEKKSEGGIHVLVQLPVEPWFEVETNAP